MFAQTEAKRQTQYQSHVLSDYDSYQFRFTQMYLTISNSVQKYLKVKNALEGSCAVRKDGIV